MAFLPRIGKKSGVCRGCDKLPNTEGECNCNSGGSDAHCMGCGAEGYVPNKYADESEMREKIGCKCQHDRLR